MAANLTILALLLTTQIDCSNQPPRYPYLVLDHGLITDTARAELIKELAAACPDVQVVAWQLPLGILEMFLHREPPRPYWFLAIWPSGGDGYYQADGSAWGWNIYRSPSEEELEKLNELVVTGQRSAEAYTEQMAGRSDGAETLKAAAPKLCATVKDPRWRPRAQSDRYPISCVEVSDSQNDARPILYPRGLPLLN